MVIGAQYRDQELEYDYDDNSNRDNFLFLVGNPDFKADRDVTAVFAEIALPLHETLEAQRAVRYEDYGSDEDTTDPKIALLYRPIDTLTLRIGGPDNNQSFNPFGSSLLANPRRAGHCRRTV